MWEYCTRSVRVVDGDTLEVDLDLGFNITHRVKLRLIGINTPEKDTPRGRDAAAFVHGWVTQQQTVPGGCVVVRTLKDRRERYGRYLANLHAADGHSLVEDLLAAGLAVPWDGTGARPT